MRAPIGLCIGTSHFGVYAIGFAGFSYGLKQWNYDEERFLLHPGWGFKSFIKLKNIFINFRLCKTYGSGRLNDTWEFGIGIGWKN